jgi:hypothetical protein
MFKNHKDLFNDPLTKALAEVASNIMEKKVMCEACGKMHEEGACAMKEGAMSELDMVADDLMKYAKKNGGIDKKDFMKAAELIKKGDMRNLVQFVSDLDTEPRDLIIMMVADAVGVKAAGKLFKVNIRASKMYETLDKAGLTEELEKDADDPCWKGYVQVGMKKGKDGKEVPNCVPMDEAFELPEELADEDVGDFVVAAAAAKKAGKKKFKFAGKEFPVTIKTDIKTEEFETCSGCKTEEKCMAEGKCLGKSIDEAMKITHVVIDTADDDKVVSMASDEKGAKSSIVTAERPPMSIKDKKTLKIVKLKKPAGQKAADKMIGYPLKEETLDEAKSNYEIKHKTFSSAIQHAVEVAAKQGYDVDPDDYDRKVAMGPKKPSKGKTNSYSIKLTKNGKEQKKALQVQIANLDNKFYELNMYIQ